MSSKAIVTNREIKNKVTGLDLYVSDFQEIPYRVKNTYLYHVIVITNLFYYKTRSHRESDIVQFMVSKSFEEFEELYRKLYKRFPSVNFPSLPKSSVFTKTRTQDRFQCMRNVLSLVAATQKLSSSPMVISFLKESTDLNKNNKPVQAEPEKIKEPVDVEEEIVEPTQENVAECAPTSEDQMEEVDLFAEEQKPNEEESIFEPPMNDTQLLKKSSLFDDEASPSTVVDDSDLFVPADAVKPPTFTAHTAYNFHDNDDLLDVDENVDDLFSLTKNSETKTIKVLKSQTSIPEGSSSRKSLSKSIESEEKDSMFKSSKPVRKPRTDSHDLSDIFSKKKGKSFFEEEEEDDDLFKSSAKKSSVPVEKAAVVEKQNLPEKPTSSEKIVAEKPTLPEKPVVENPNLQEKPVVENPNLQEKPVVEKPTLPEKPVVEKPNLQEKAAVEKPNLQEKAAVDEKPTFPEKPNLPEKPSLPEKPRSPIVVEKPLLPEKPSSENTTSNPEIQTAVDNTLTIEKGIETVPITENLETVHSESVSVESEVNVVDSIETNATTVETKDNHIETDDLVESKDDVIEENSDIIDSPTDNNIEEIEEDDLIKPKEVDIKLNAEIETNITTVDAKSPTHDTENKGDVDIENLDDVMSYIEKQGEQEKEVSLF